MLSSQSPEGDRPLKRGSMLLSAERLAYAGLIGAPSRRVLGATSIYVAVDSPFEISIDGAARKRAWLAVVAPNRPHEISSGDRTIRKVLLEPESLSDVSALPLPELVISRQAVSYRAISAVFVAWLQGDAPASDSTESFDRFFFGHRLERRRIDPRVERVVRRLQAEPFAHLSAGECARSVNLSVPRFVHLFNDDLGTTLRAYCMWKRARAVLPSLATPCNLTQLAMAAGYADSAHFSHSIRRVFGLRPRDILAGSQRLALRWSPAPSPDVTRV